jgi:hypothetical protein
MRFLRKTDYYRLIQPNDLETLLQSAVEAGYNGEQLLIDSELSAMETIKSYLAARYDLDRAFSDTPVFDISKSYYAQSRVQYHEPTYSTSSTYPLNARVSINGNIYECTTAITAAEPFTISNWKFICLDYALFYVLNPAPEFQELTNYPTGSVVWFSDNYTYTALRDTTGQSLNMSVYSEYGADRSGEYTLKEDVANSAYWLRNSLYSFSGALPTDGTRWALGDNRNALLVEKVIDISLYNLWTVAAPRNIPEVRIIRYHGRSVNDDSCAMGWLKAVASGDISANIPGKYPIQGLSIVFNTGTPKQINTY